MRKQKPNPEVQVERIIVKYEDEEDKEDEEDEENEEGEEDEYGENE